MAPVASSCDVPVLITIAPESPEVPESPVWIAMPPDVATVLAPDQICTRPAVRPDEDVEPEDSTMSPPVAAPLPSPDEMYTAPPRPPAAVVPAPIRTEPELPLAALPVLITMFPV